jgi:hypothetical protein
MVGTRKWGSWGNRDENPGTLLGILVLIHAQALLLSLMLRPAASSLRLPCLAATAAGHRRPERQSSPTPLASPSRPSVHLQQIGGRQARLDAQITAQEFDHEALLGKENN